MVIFIVDALISDQHQQNSVCTQLFHKTAYTT